MESCHVGVYPVGVERDNEVASRKHVHIESDEALPDSTVFTAQAAMRICFFNTTRFWGGGEKWHLETAIGLSAKGHSVVVAGYPGSALIERARASQLDTVEFPVTKLSALNPLLFWKLKRFFQGSAVEAVVFNGPDDVKAGGLGAWAAGVPRRVYRRGIALPVKDRWVNRFLFTKVLTHIITNSEETKRTLLAKLGADLSSKHVEVMSNGIDLASFDRQIGTHGTEPGDRDGDDGEVVLGNVGRLTRQKGQSLLLEVAQRLQGEGLRFRLLIAGDGDLLGELRARAAELDVQDRVHFLGFVEDVPGFLAGIDVFLLSSLWEGFGYVIAEAGAARRPVVAFDVSSNPEIIEHGTSGYLVPPGDVDAFAARVRELMMDEELRRRMGQAARRLVDERFRLDRKVDEFERYLLQT